MVEIESFKRILSTEDKVQTEPNKYFKKDTEYALKFNRWLLNPISLWPLPPQVSSLKKIQFKLVRTICWALLAFIIIPACLHTILIQPDRRIKMKMTGPISFCFMVIVKYFVFVVRAESIKTCIDQIITDWRNVNTAEDRKIMIESSKAARLFTFGSVLLMYGGGCSYTLLLPLTASKSVSTSNVTIRVLPYPCYIFIFDTQVSPTYEIVFLAQIMCNIVRYSTTSGVCSLAVVFAMHVDGQCQVLMRILEDFVNGDRDKSSTLHQRLTDVVVRHLRILKLVSVMENIYNEIVLVELVGCTLILCFLGFFTSNLTVKDTFSLFSYFLLLTSLTFNVFTFCYIGELVTNQCLRIGQAAYMTEWYRLGGKNASNLIVLIIISNRPVFLTAGRMINLSYNSFFQVMKAAVAYLNILREITT